MIPTSRNAIARLLLAVLCLLLLIGLLAWGRFPSGRQHPAVPLASAGGLSNQDCRSCHDQVWQEWEESNHSRAWTSPDVQAAFQHFGFDRKCESCHAPQPILQTGLEEEVQLRKEDRESGVNCLSCHALPDGGVAAARTLPDAPCRPQQFSALASSRHCGGCHTAIYDDWQDSRYAREEKTCQSCHMPETNSRPGGYSHLCLGGYDEALVRSGVRMECRQQGQELVVSVTNHATGHNFPGERHNRVLLLEMVQRSADGQVTLARQQIIKDITPFRGESSTEHLRIDETVEYRFPAVGPPGVAEVKLLYKHFPWHPDRKALVVHQAELPLEPFSQEEN